MRVICRSIRMHQNIEGLTIGILSGVCIIYGFQTRVKYPLWVIKSYDHPWVLLALLILSLYLFQVNRIIGALMILITTALIIDGIIFTRTLKM